MDRRRLDFEGQPILYTLNTPVTFHWNSFYFLRNTMLNTHSRRSVYVGGEFFNASLFSYKHCRNTTDASTTVTTADITCTTCTPV